ncbi:uncharacterized protein [Diadema setosum]|uniref:uncharacterized protein n=1 Tax=Diadema setosum TaxID=31175 RepID=UPI003B3B1A7A
MAKLDKLCVRGLLLMSALHNFCGGMTSKIGSVCEFASMMTYDDKSSECPNGAEDLNLCRPGQMKIKQCIRADEDTTNICEDCPQKFFQKNFNRCVDCHQCSECGTNERIKTRCTVESDTVCESILPEPETTSRRSTTVPSTASLSSSSNPTTPPSKSSTATTTCENCETSRSSGDNTTITPEPEMTTEFVGRGHVDSSKEEPSDTYRIFSIMTTALLVLSVGFNIFLFFFFIKYKRKILESKRAENPPVRSDSRRAGTKEEMKPLSNGIRKENETPHSVENVIVSKPGSKQSRGLKLLLQGGCNPEEEEEEKEEEEEEKNLQLTSSGRTIGRESSI